MSLETEQKIKEAAQKVFKQKGFAAARTRDIAEEAGVNLALINYYYKGKEQLFNIIMFETMESFKNTIITFLNDDSIDFESNLRRLVGCYTDLFLQEPDLIFFMLGELRNHTGELIERINPHDLLTGSAFEKKMKEAMGNASIDSAQIFINIFSMVLFPFIGKQVVQNVCGIDEEGFRKIVKQRCELIPLWIDTIIKNSK